MDGQPIGTCLVYTDGTLGPGPCEACGKAPLHGPLTNCTCSYVKGGQRLCRACAIAYDYVTVGHTKITDAPFTVRQWAAYQEVLMTGNKAAGL